MWTQHWPFLSLLQIHRITTTPLQLPSAEAHTACGFVWLMMKDYLVFFLLKLALPWSLPSCVHSLCPGIRKSAKKFILIKFWDFF